MVVFFVLLALVLLRLLLIGAGALLLVRRVHDCPACFRPTVPVLRRWLPRWPRSLEWRWCPACGWQGPARKAATRAGDATRR